MTPSVYPTVLFDRLDEFMLEFDQHDQLVQAGVMVEGAPAAYAYVWEWGNVRQTQIGPKTTVGINPDGEEVFLSIQAPMGYVAVNTARFWELIPRELERMKFDQPNARSMTQEMEKVAGRISKGMTRFVKETVPIGEGDLYAAIKATDPNDPILDQDEDNGALVLEE